MDEDEGRGLPKGLTADIAVLAAVMAEHGLHEITIEAGGVRVSLTGSAATALALPVALPAAANATDGDATALAAFAAAASVGDGAASGMYDFRSPMIGTFYTASGPGEEPYARVGDRLSAGQTVAIIEAMKINNEIQVDRPGTVEEVYVSNGQPVEYNQPLFRLSLG